MSIDVERGVRAIVEKDPRFHPHAYFFLYAALEFTVHRLREERGIPKGERMRVTGGELLDGVRDLARDQFGPLSKVVLEEWGVSATSDIGDIVFNLVTGGLLKKDEKDKREDFENVYDFQSAFVDEYDVEFAEGV